MSSRDGDKDCDGWIVKLLYFVVILLACFVIAASSHTAIRGGFSTLQHSIPESITREGDLDRRSRDMAYAFPVSSRELLRADIEAFRKLIVDYYGTEEAMRSMFVLKTNESAYADSLDYVAEKFARALIYKKNFTIGVMGNSVMAGHDNCAYDNYEHQLERTLTPILAKYNVNFTIRNAAETGGCGDKQGNQIWCMQHMIGDNVDVTHYGWTYMEGESAVTYKETFARWSLLLPGSPAPLITDVGCPKDGIAHRDLQAMIRAYSKFGSNHLMMMCAAKMHLGFPEGNIPWGTIGDGKHNTTRYADQEKDMYPGRTASLGVFMRNWHPGPKLFENVADAMAHYYLTAIERALAKIEFFEETGTHLTTDAWLQYDSPTLSVKALPDALFAQGPWLAPGYLPKCHNFEDPTHGVPQIELVPLNSTENPFYNDKLGPDLVGWPRLVPEQFTQLIPAEERKFPKCQFIDRCSALEHLKGAKSGFLTFKIPRLDIGMLVVCRGNTGADLKLDGKLATIGDWMRATLKNVWINKIPLSKEPFIEYPIKKCFRIQENFTEPVRRQIGNDPHFYLTLDFGEDTDRLLISHVFGV